MLSGERMEWRNIFPRPVHDILPRNTTWRVRPPRRPDDHAARPAIRPRPQAGPLVDGRRSGGDRFLQRFVGDLPQGRGLLRRERPQLPRGHAAQARRRDQGLRHPGSDAQPRARPVQQARSGGGLRHVDARKAGRVAAVDDQGPGRRSSTSPRPCASSISPRSSPINCSAIRAISTRPIRRAPRCGAGTRSRRSSIRASPTTPGFTRPGTGRGQALEGQGQGDAVRHPQFRRRPKPRHSRLLRQDGITGARAWGRMLWFTWARPGMLRKILGAWLAFFLPGFHPWKHDDRALIAKADLIRRAPSRISSRALARGAVRGFSRNGKSRKNNGRCDFTLCEFLFRLHG
jgi:hypothetical protein